MAPDQYDRSAVVAGCRNAQASFSTEPCYGTGRFSQKGIARRFLPTKFFVGFVLLLMAMQFPQVSFLLKAWNVFLCADICIPSFRKNTMSRSMWSEELVTLKSPNLTGTADAVDNVSDGFVIRRPHILLFCSFVLLTAFKARQVNTAHRPWSDI